MNTMSLTVFCLLAVASVASEAMNRKLGANNCDNSMNVFGVLNNEHSPLTYFLFSFDDKSSNTVAIGDSSLSASSTDEWCLKNGQYVLFIEQVSTTEASSLTICNDITVSSNSYVMFSVDHNRCDVIVHGETSVLPIRKLVSSVTAMDMSMVGSYDMSADMSMEMSMEMSMDMSMDVSMDSSMHMGSMDSSMHMGSMDSSMHMGSMDSSMPVDVSMDYSMDMGSMEMSGAVPMTDAPTFAPTRAPSAKPTRAPTTFLSNLEISTFTANCFADCSYVSGSGTTVPYSTSWTNVDYCSFYTSTGCTNEGVSGYSCVPTCLTDCPSSFCSVFSYTALGCSGGGTMDAAETMESECLDSQRAGNDAETDIEFTLSLDMDGMDPADVDDLTESQIEACASSMAGVTTSDVTLNSATAYSDGGRRLSNSVSALASGVSFNFSVNVVAEDLGYSYDTATDAFDSLVEQFEENVDNGNYEEVFTTAATNSGYSSKVASVTVNKASVKTSSSPNVVQAATNAPTVAPTPGPTKKSGSDDDDERKRTGVIIGAVIGSVVGVALIGFVVYYLYFMESVEDKEIAFKQATKVRAGQNQRADEDFL